jgi:hypothetical protein
VALATVVIDDSLRIRFLDRDLGRGRDAFRELDQRIPVVAARVPDWRWEIDAGAEVPHGAVIHVLDTLMRAGVDLVDFRGAPPPGGKR